MFEDLGKRPGEIAFVKAGWLEQQAPGHRQAIDSVVDDVHVRSRSMSLPAPASRGPADFVQ